MYIHGIIKDKNCTLYRINAMEDHVHILTSLNPTIALADFAHDLTCIIHTLSAANANYLPSSVMLALHSLNVARYILRDLSLCSHWRTGT